jgi:hypothetical protein
MVGKKNMISGSCRVSLFKEHRRSSTTSYIGRIKKVNSKEWN